MTLTPDTASHKPKQSETRDSGRIKGQGERGIRETATLGRPAPFETTAVESVYDEGYDAGLNEGYDIGFDLAMEEMQKEVKRAHQEGYCEGLVAHEDYEE